MLVPRKLMSLILSLSIAFLFFTCLRAHGGEVQDAMDMILFCATEPPQGPLGAVEPRNPLVSQYEKLLLVCLWSVDSRCATNALTELRTLLAGDERPVVANLLENVYAKELQSLGEGAGVLSTHAVGQQLQESLLNGRYDIAEQILEGTRGQEEVYRQLWLAHQLFKFPGVIYTSITSPYSLLTGDVDADVRNLQAVAEAASKTHEQLKDEMNLFKGAESNFVSIRDRMRTMLAANRRGIAAKYAKLLLTAPEEFRNEALAVRATAFLCGETGLKGERPSDAATLYSRLLEPGKPMPAFVTRALQLATGQPPITWEKALEIVAQAHQNRQKLPEPSFVHIPVLPSMVESWRLRRQQQLAQSMAQAPVRSPELEQQELVEQQQKQRGQPAGEPEVEVEIGQGQEEQKGAQIEMPILSTPEPMEAPAVPNFESLTLEGRKMVAPISEEITSLNAEDLAAIRRQLRPVNSGGAIPRSALQFKKVALTPGGVPVLQSNLDRFGTATGAKGSPGQSPSAGTFIGRGNLPGVSKNTRGAFFKVPSPPASGTVETGVKTMGTARIANSSGRTVFGAQLRSTLPKVEKPPEGRSGLFDWKSMANSQKGSFPSKGRRPFRAGY